MILILLLPILAIIAWMAWDSWLAHEREMEFWKRQHRDEEDDK